MNHNPLVSIGFTVYNGASRMRPALDSLRAQTYRNIELIISDNASSDETQKICEEYAKNDSRIYYMRQPHNIGQVPNFIAVLKQARGEYFMWAADDDMRDPRFIETLVGALDANPAHGVSMCSYENRYEDGVLQNTVLLHHKLHLTDDSHYSLYKKIILNKPIHHFLHGLHRRAHLIQFFDRPISPCIRWDRVFMAEYALATRFASVPEILFSKRVTREAIAERYSNDFVGSAFRNPLAYTRYVCLLLWRPLTSRHIPLHRKMYAVPAWALAFWHYKQKMMKEFLSVVTD